MRGASCLWQPGGREAFEESDVDLKLSGLVIEVAYCGTFARVTQSSKFGYFYSPTETLWPEL